MINSKKLNLAFLSLFLLVFPFLLSAQAGSPPNPTPAPSGTTQSSSANTGITFECITTGPRGEKVYGNCTYANLIQATKKAIDKFIVLTLELTVVVIAWAGFKFMTSGDSSQKRKEASTMLWKVAVGIGFILGAWLIVTLITSALLKDTITGILPLK